MMNKKDLKRDNVATISLDDLVPKNHLVRKFDKALDFSFIYDEVEHLYSKIGAPSVDPVVLIKIVLKLSIYIEKGRVLKLKNLPFCL